jgi:3-hydroxyisobutyrate dehydrogenase-like beta-hydroxyacid dehydrogenase
VRKLPGNSGNLALLTYSEPLSSKANQFSLHSQLWQVYCYVIASMANRQILLAVASIVLATQDAGYAQDTVRSAGESLTATKTAAQAQGPTLPQPDSRRTNC